MQTARILRYVYYTSYVNLKGVCVCYVHYVFGHHARDSHLQLIQESQDEVKNGVKMEILFSQVWTFVPITMLTRHNA